MPSWSRRHCWPRQRMLSGRTRQWSRYAFGFFLLQRSNEFVFACTVVVSLYLSSAFDYRKRYFPTSKKGER
jgi:hypothetical protein